MPAGIAETLGDDRWALDLGGDEPRRRRPSLAAAFRPLGALLSPPEVGSGGSATTPDVLSTTPDRRDRRSLVETRRMPFREAAVAREARHTLTLTP
jgi:hypothetical protein